MNDEVWRPVIIDGYNTDYEVSNLGNVRNSKTKERVHQYLNDKGYCKVCFRKSCVDSNIKRLVYSVHRLVLLAFDYIENHKEMTGDHKDKDKLNNTLDNLRWLTRKENSEESHKFGRVYGKGPESNRHIYELEQIRLVCELIQDNEYTMPEISTMSGVALHTVQKIKSGKQWTNISCDYEFPDLRVQTENVVYTADNQNEIEKLLDIDYMMQTRDIVSKISLPDTQATKAYINRVRKKYIANLEKERVQRLSKAICV